MNITVGQTVRGENFWSREYEIADIWDAIESGTNVLISAPRRVGKTSIMYHLLDNPKEGYVVLYVNPESSENKNEFWYKLFQVLTDESFINTLGTKAKNIWDSIKSTRFNLSIEGISFNAGKIEDYEEAFKRIIKDLESDTKIIIMIDEFAQVIDNMIKNDSVKNAEKFLQVHHGLRQDRKISDKVTFIYTGSIGLESVVSKINGIKYINDLNSIIIPPLTYDESQKFVTMILKENDFEMELEQIDYLLKKIEWLIPFYIQLLMQELKRINRRNNATLTNASIDKAMENAIGHRNHFESWENKLEERLSEDEYSYVEELLNSISTEVLLTSSRIKEMAKGHSLNEKSAKKLINALVYDGYINNNDNVEEYRFNSPILREWWKKNVAN